VSFEKNGNGYHHCFCVKSYSGTLCQRSSKGAIKKRGGGCSATLCPKRRKECEEKREGEKRRGEREEERRKERKEREKEEGRGRER
jgi:hypothetical protein